MNVNRPIIRHASLLALLLVILLSACQAATDGSGTPAQTGQPPQTVAALSTPEAASYPTPEPYAFPSSEKGFITLHGSLVAKNPFAMAPDPDDPVFLVPLVGDPASISSIPPFVIGEVPRATVDITNGEFVIANIEPGQYALVVLLNSGSQVPAKFMSNGNLAILTLTEADIDQVVEVEPVSVP